MKTLLKYEFYKLWKRRFVPLSLLLMLILIVLHSQYDNTSEYRELSLQAEQLILPLNGTMDAQFPKKINTLQTSTKSKNSPLEDFQIEQIFNEPKQAFIYYQTDMQQHTKIATMPDSILKDRLLHVSQMENIQYRAQGSTWANTIYYMDLYSYYCIFLGIIITVSTVFSHDREVRVEELQSTCKEGRRMGVKAKLLCSYLTAALLWLMFLAIPLFFTLYYQGEEGLKATLSLYYPYNNSGYSFSSLTMLCWLFILSLLGIMVFTTLVLIVTRTIPSMLKAGMLALALFALPLVVNGLPILTYFASLMPSYTSRLINAIHKADGIQIGPLAFLDYELIALWNIFLLCILVVLLYSSIHGIRRKGGHLHV